MLLKETEGRIEVTGRRRVRREQLMADLKDTGNLERKKALDRTLWRSRFQRCYGSVVSTCQRNECPFQWLLVSLVLYLAKLSFIRLYSFGGRWTDVSMER
jgi:hypothetical protein